MSDEWIFGSTTRRRAPGVPRTTPRFRAAVACLAAASVALVALHLGAGSEHARTTVLVVAQLATMAAFAATVRTGRHGLGRDWAVLLVAVTVQSVGNLTGGPFLEPRPQPHDWFICATTSAVASALMALAVVGIARREGFSPHASVAVDAVTHALASLLLWWVAIGRPLVLSPREATPESVAAGLLPLADGLLLVATGVLLGSRVGQSLMARAMLAYCLLGLLADLGAARVAVDHVAQVPSWIPLVWLLQLPCLVLVAMTSQRTTPESRAALPHTAVLLTLVSIASPGVVGMYAASHPLAPCAAGEGPHLFSRTVNATCAVSLASPTGRVGLSTITIVIVVAGAVVMAGLVAVRFRQLVRGLEDQAARLERTARTDDLTGLPNRRAGTRILTAAVEAAREHPETLAVAVVDLDHFKTYNDTHGHQEGDHLLQESARAWAAALARGVVYRYGGEEFVVVMPDHTVDEATRALGLLRAVVPRGQSFSAGLTTARAGDTVTSVIARADAALYESKEHGRDRITLG